jgi:acyl-homoserine lactone acylase PvdQ
MNMSLKMRRMIRLVCALLVALVAPLWNLQARDRLADQVTIYRDEYGVPHIVGDTEEATFFGYGYAQALEKKQSAMADPRIRRAVETLKGWDYRSATDSVAQTYIYFWAQPRGGEK